MAFRPNLLGCYFLTSNQVIAYERSDTHEVDQTLIHEAMHQIAFNTGLHSRIRPQPKWVIEGLALVYEADGIRNRQGTKVGDRINPERYRWFNDYLRSRRTARSLAQFLKSDDLFVTQTLDAYSETWAFSFFLLETRSDKYVHYLKMLARSDMAASNADDDRLANFTNVFGDDLDQLEADYLRFLKRVAPQ